MTLPIWVYLVFAGIIFSAIMTIRSAKTEEMVDQEYIEREGEVYIKRMEDEKTRRRMVQ
jgi:Na+/glutamate symporter